MKCCSKCNMFLPEENFRITKGYKNNLFCWCLCCESQYRKNYPKNKKEKSRIKWNKNNPDYIKKYQIQNTERLKSYRKNYYKKNSKEIIRKSINWTKNNRIRSRKIKSNWKLNNRTKINEYIQNKRKSNLAFRLRCIVSKSIWYYLKIQKKNKNGSCWSYLPYTPENLKRHLESKFDSWMSWENYGTYHKNKKRWQIDHIIPQSKLPYKSLTDKNFLKCWDLSNLRPLEISENIKKSDYYNEK